MKGQIFVKELTIKADSLNDVAATLSNWWTLLSVRM
jgi:hypothetical protein